MTKRVGRASSDPFPPLGRSAGLCSSERKNKGYMLCGLLTAVHNPRVARWTYVLGSCPGNTTPHPISSWVWTLPVWGWAPGELRCLGNALLLRKLLLIITYRKQNRKHGKSNSQGAPCIVPSHHLAKACGTNEWLNVLYTNSGNLRTSLEFKIFPTHFNSLKFL